MTAITKISPKKALWQIIRDEGYKELKMVCYVGRLVQAINNDCFINQEQMAELIRTLNDDVNEVFIMNQGRSGLLGAPSHLVVASWLNSCNDTL